MKLERQTRSYRRDARREATNPCRVVSSDHIVACASNPLQPITDTVHNRLQATNVSLAIFPGNQRFNSCQALNCLGGKRSPITTVDDQRKTGCGSKTAVVVEEAVLIGVRVIRRERENGSGSHPLSSLRHFASESGVETYACNHRYTTVNSV